MTRTVGILLIAAAALVCLIGGVLMGTGLAAGAAGPNQGLTAGGAALGFALFLIVAGLLAAGGVFALTRSRHEQKEQADADALRKILDMVKTRGAVDISDVVIELGSSTPAVKDMVYKLVGMGVFSGYINWDEGKLYSEEASALRGTEQCKNCGGNLSLAGKGVIRCPFCGTEYFLS